MLKRLDDVFLATSILLGSTNYEVLQLMAVFLMFMAFLVFLAKGQINKFSPILSILTLIICAIYLQPGILFLMISFIVCLGVFLLSVAFGE